MGRSSLKYQYTPAIIAVTLNVVKMNNQISQRKSLEDLPFLLFSARSFRISFLLLSLLIRLKLSNNVLLSKKLCVDKKPLTLNRVVDKYFSLLF